MTPSFKRRREEPPVQPVEEQPGLPQGKLENAVLASSLRRAKTIAAREAAMLVIAKAIDEAVAGLNGPAKAQGKKIAHNFLKVLQATPEPSEPNAGHQPVSGTKVPIKVETKAPQPPKKPLGGQKPPRKERKDYRLLVRTPADDTSISDDPVRITGLRAFLGNNNKLVQRITKTKTGVALWPFPGVKGGRALHEAQPQIQKDWQEKRPGHRVELPVRWHTRVIDDMPISDMNKIQKELTAATGVRSFAGGGLRDGKRLVIHFAEPPPRFSVFGRWARPVKPKSKKRGE